jgi:hypothetical protein
MGNRKYFLCSWTTFQILTMRNRGRRLGVVEGRGAKAKGVSPAALQIAGGRRNKKKKGKVRMHKATRAVMESIGIMIIAMMATMRRRRRKKGKGIWRCEDSQLPRVPQKDKRQRRAGEGGSSAHSRLCGGV